MIMAVYLWVSQVHFWSFSLCSPSGGLIPGSALRNSYLNTNRFLLKENTVMVENAIIKQDTKRKGRKPECPTHLLLHESHRS